MSSTFTFCCHLTDLYTRKKIRKCRVQSGMAACFKTGTLRYTCWLSATAYHSSGCCVFCACLHRRPLFYFIFFLIEMLTLWQCSQGLLMVPYFVVLQSSSKLRRAPPFHFEGGTPTFFIVVALFPSPNMGPTFSDFFGPGRIRTLHLWRGVEWLVTTQVVAPTRALLHWYQSYRDLLFHLPDTLLDKKGSHCSGPAEACRFLCLQSFGYKQSRREPAPRVVKSELAFLSVRELCMTWMAMILQLTWASVLALAGSCRWPFQAHVLYKKITASHPSGRLFFIFLWWANTASNVRIWRMVLLYCFTRCTAIACRLNPLPTVVASAAKSVPAPCAHDMYPSFSKLLYCFISEPLSRPALAWPWSPTAV